jgi:AMP phosphorylase
VVVDMPVGPGTKLPRPENGRSLAKDLIDLGERLGIRVECAMTFGGSPVGRTIGPALEVREALTVLENKGGPNSLKEKSLALAGILLEMGGVAGRGDGYKVAEEILSSGKAHKKLMEIVEAQGGNPNIKGEEIEIGENCDDLLAPNSGYVVAFFNKRLVELARMAGAPSDKKAGVIIHKKMGEQVKKGEPLITICSSSDWELESAMKDAKRAMPIVVEGMLLERYPRVTEI